MYRDGWMDGALADKVHKQGEHIPQYCYISHNHPYREFSLVAHVRILPLHSGHASVQKCTVINGEKALLPSLWGNAGS